jgi:hypothetical protein
VVRPDDFTGILLDGYTEATGARDPEFSRGLPE